MSRRFIPNELVDEVIDHNHDDRTTLFASALVSRQWIRASRYHIFTEVEISHHNAREFIMLLTSPHCTFTTTLHGLNIELAPGSQRWFGEFSRRLFSFSQISISALTLSGPSNSVIREEATSALAPFYGRLRRFLVDALVFDSFARFAQILCSFTTLESISCSATFRLTALPPDLHCACPLRALALASPAIQPVLEFLLAQGVLPTVASMSLCHPAQGDYPILARYLRTSNDSLHSLSIKMDGPFSGVSIDDFAEALDLSQLKALRHLVVDTTPKLTPAQAYTVLASAAPAAQLETLKISVELVQGTARVDIFLSSHRFASLQRVVVLGASWDEVLQILPRCDAKNILQQS